MYYINTCVTRENYISHYNPEFNPIKMVLVVLEVFCFYRESDKKKSYKVAVKVPCSNVVIIIFEIFFSGCHSSPHHCWDGGPDTPREGEVFPYLHRGEAAFPQPA